MPMMNGSTGLPFSSYHARRPSVLMKEFFTRAGCSSKSMMMGVGNQEAIKTLNDIDRISAALFASLSSQPVKPGRVSVGALAQLSQLDSALAVHLEELRGHQLRQGIIATLETDIIELEESIQHSLHTLKQSQNDLGRIVQDSDKDKAQMRAAEESKIPHETLLEYAQKLAAFTHAPPSLTTNDSHAPQQPFNMPFPTESNMRRGILFAQGEEHTLTLEMGESREVEAEKVVHHPINSTAQEQQHMQAFDGDGDVEFDLLD
ncbi:hypothetical protein E3P89_01031 [Wallemia ichthyophaga]|uniref:Mediator of RNA polymerase II transcription subunit 4 n=2 Tax=Wallemia ichthyophaga TaxID=245174 RepID=A0A4T0I5G1_WALIC|nr:hypothetical protein E3P90_01326 [Wallemia ichthyophaga]TIB16215.1 hypothetical protein E3P93_01077 [Wallemia ichthyophaga]TIB24480.1 hypothetical protein E3P89_01031 [Wallemia ichthyophaga]TIB26153.1 hypothetical protein E3P88_01195 [Wallemia ichthyophaga]